MFDEVSSHVDLETLHQRLDQRPPNEWGAQSPERQLIVHLHRTKSDIPTTGVVIMRPERSQTSWTRSSELQVWSAATAPRVAIVFDCE